MRNLPAYETIDDINFVIDDLNEATGMLKYISKYSSHVQQARFEQFIRTLTETTTALTTIKESL